MREVIKVDITKELIAVQDHQPYIDYADREPVNLIAKMGEMPPAISMESKRKRYGIRQVYNPETRSKTLYAVLEDDDKIFRELVAVSIGYIEQEVAKAREKLWGEMEHIVIPRELAAQKNRIKNLPWYKRLFNYY